MNTVIRTAHLPTTNLKEEATLFHKGIKFIEKSNNTVHYRFENVVDNIVGGNVISNHTLHSTPKRLKIKLKLHQQRMLHEMIQKESFTYRIGNKINMFVLSDKVGSGKSIDILALICEHPVLDDTKYLNINTMNYKIPKIYRRFRGLQLVPTVIFKTNLIVIPHNIFNQWQTYIQDCTDLTVYPINVRKNIKNMVFKDIIEGKYNIILVKSTMYNDLMTHIYHKFPISAKNIYHDAEYKNLNLVKKLSDQVHAEFNKSLYNINNNRDKIIKEKFKLLHKTINAINIDHILQTMSSDYQQLYDIYSFRGPIFERVIFDEASSIKIPRCKKALGKINWFITSSVEDLMYPWGKWKFNQDNRGGAPVSQINGVIGSGFIKDTFGDNSHKYLLTSIQDMYLKNNNTFIEESFGLPDPIQDIIKCWTPPELLVLTGIATPEVIRALNAGDSASAIRMTNCNVSNETDIVKSTLSLLNVSLSKYNQLLEEKSKIKADIKSTLVLHISDEERLDIRKKIKNLNTSLKNFTTKKNDILFKRTSIEY